MGLRQHQNFLCIVFLVHSVCDGSAFDLAGKIAKRPGHDVLDKRDQYLCNNSNPKSNIYGQNSLTEHPYIKWERMPIFSWRNVKANKDTKSTISTNQRDKRHFTFISRYKSQSTTPSYIEFYYLDDKDEQSIIRNYSFNRFDKNKPKQFKTSTKPNPQSPISFRLNGPYIRKVLVNPRSNNLRNFQESLLYPQIQTVNNPSNEKAYKLKHKVRSSKAVNNGTETVLNQKLATVKESFNGSRLSTKNTTSEEQTALKLRIFLTLPPSATVSTIPHDRVKFFEMYDNNTLQPPVKDKHINETSEREPQSDDANFPRRNSIEDTNNHVNRRHCDSPHKTRYEKNITDFTTKEVKIKTAVANPIPESNASQSLPFTIQYSTNTLESKEASTVDLSRLSISGVITEKAWSSYSFASVYVYKPTQTHCDAAGISPHWLVAAGSCLSRHHLIASLDERSAFVTFCGEHWQVPERVAYVKRSMVHPKFSPRDEVRRLLYNIGLIEVSSSMASCHGWKPVTLMSHQFNAEPVGSMAAAVGWGLDRYGTLYSSETLPRRPLTVYESLMFCGICPGSTTYSVAKQYGGADNVYCLLLPPYEGEETDPVHGGLLLVNGKLVALYLQEERRSSGPQSALYTGVWRLLPWIMDTAREPYDEALDI